MLPRRPRPLAETLAAIEQADLITLGPGSLYTSVIPNLLVSGIPQAIARSTALTTYFVNLMSQPGETTNMSAADHVAAITRHCGRLGSQRLIDVCVVNSRPIRGRALARYRAKAAQPVENDFEKLQALGCEVLATDLLRTSGDLFKEKIRHDPSVLGAVAMNLAQQGQRRKRRA